MAARCCRRRPVPAICGTPIPRVGTTPDSAAPRCAALPGDPGGGRDRAARQCATGGEGLAAGQRADRRTAWRSPPRGHWSAETGCGSGWPPPTRCYRSRPVRSRPAVSAPRSRLPCSLGVVPHDPCAGSAASSRRSRRTAGCASSRTPSGRRPPGLVGWARAGHRQCIRPVAVRPVAAVTRGRFRRGGDPRVMAWCASCGGRACGAAGVVAAVVGAGVAAPGVVGVGHRPTARGFAVDAIASDRSAVAATGGPGMPPTWLDAVVVLAALAGLLQLTRPGPARLGWLIAIDAVVGGVLVVAHARELCRAALRNWLVGPGSPLHLPVRAC